jgi:glycosyltransferase involved in cell wall biosynthesis
MIIGIDASNIRAGGGVTHLFEFLKAAKPANYGVNKVIVWSGSSTLARIEERDWLEKREEKLLNKSLPFRLFWSIFCLKKLAKLALCDLLFVPGGSDASNFKPMVTMSQNLLPFEWRELRRYGLSFMTLKSILLRFSQSRTFRKADGVIFLTEYAEKAALSVTGDLKGKRAVIAHGINPIFDNPPHKNRYQKQFSQENPCRILYVSGLEPYKHQWHVAEAVNKIKLQGIPVFLDLVGPKGPGLRRLEDTLKRLDPDERFIKYHGPVKYENLKNMYASADIGVFASSCETFGQILTEAMSAGLPMACSDRSAMKEILETYGVYFDPESPDEISTAILKLMEDSNLRETLANDAYLKSKTYSWDKCANETLEFLALNARTN